jgi:hypothetical protein
VKETATVITRQIPKPIVLVDTREKYPFISAVSKLERRIKKQALKAALSVEAWSP